MLQKLRKLLNDVITSFVEGWHRGWNMNRPTVPTSMADFLSATGSGPKWTEAEILRWIASLSDHDQDILRNAAVKAQADGKDPHQFICDVRSAHERKQCAIGMNGPAVGPAFGLLEQVQFTTVIADQFWHNLLGNSYGAGGSYGDGVSSGYRKDA